MKICLTFILTALFISVLFAQQIPDSSFNPPIPKPAYEPGKGPVVAIDEAHFNFHTKENRYLAFARLIERDGYQVVGNSVPFSAESLDKIDILVIANALSERNQYRDDGDTDWTLPTPSAFTEDEIKALDLWIKNGGKLFLIADHMPFPGCNLDLGNLFGIRMTNGFALDHDQNGQIVFHTSNGTLRKHPITRGRNTAEKIDSVTSFTGQAFQPDSGLSPLMILPDDAVMLMTSVAGEFGLLTPELNVGGWYQGVTKDYGKGRVAVFGEAAMFSAQLAGPDRMALGMNDPNAPQNVQFLLNIMHWLSGILK